MSNRPYVDIEPFNPGSVWDFERTHRNSTPEEIGLSITKGLSKDHLRRFAVSYVVHLVEEIRRAGARQKEQTAELLAYEKAQREAERRAAQRQTQREQEMREQLFDNPTTHIGRREDRETWRLSLGDKFNEWYQRGRVESEAEGGRGELEWFESQWHPDGPTAYWDEKRYQDVLQLVRVHSERVRLETTRELLATAFALGDGESVTWGRATIAQHEQRIEMLAKNVSGVIETATRHQAAINMIKEASVDCLAELAS